MFRRASALFEKLRKERDFHKMHHRRVVEEKNKLVRDLKRLLKHTAKYVYSLLAFLTLNYYYFPTNLFQLRARVARDEEPL